MGLFFLISGYFVPRAYDRKGATAFLKDRFRRLGIPLLLFGLLVTGPMLYFSQDEPYNLKEGGPSRWDEIKQEIADAGLETLRQHTTNLGPENILGRFIRTPLDFERCNPAWLTGDANHIGPFLSQMFANRPLPGWGRYRTPVKKLYMCGASTHPGPAVNAASRAAMPVIMEDLGIDFKRVIAK